MENLPKVLTSLYQSFNMGDTSRLGNFSIWLG